MYFFSVKNKGIEEIVIKKSRFIGYVAPVINEEEVQQILANTRERWPQARHYCYAYILKNGGERYSDDGEPSGTAGVPILSVLRNNQIEDVICVVTRYFGGVLLGAPGLVRAYSQAASSALQTAGIKKLELCAYLQISCDYTYWGNIEHKCMQDGILVENIEYLDIVKATVYCPLDYQESFISKVISLSNGTAEITSHGETYQSLN